MFLDKLKLFCSVFFFFASLWFLNACKDIEAISEEKKSCNALNDTLNKRAVSYYNVSSLAADTVKKNQSCEAYLKALIDYTSVSNKNKCFLSKSDSINNARMLSTVRCKCTDAFILVNTADVTFLNSSKLAKDTVIKNDNCEALAKQLKNFITIASWYKCFSSKSDSVAFALKLNGLGCKCTDAFNTVKATESIYKKKIPIADTTKQCRNYSQALTNYLKIGSSYKCLSAIDSTAYARILTSLKCK
jgi:hypothetical protein